MKKKLFLILTTLFFLVEVEKVIKGEIKQGDTITLKQPGGKYTGLTENKKIETLKASYIWKKAVSI